MPTPPGIGVDSPSSGSELDEGHDSARCWPEPKFPSSVSIDLENGCAPSENRAPEEPDEDQEWLSPLLESPLPPAPTLKTFRLVELGVG